MGSKTAGKGGMTVNIFKFFQSKGNKTFRRKIFYLSYPSNFNKRYTFLQKEDSIYFLIFSRLTFKRLLLGKFLCIHKGLYPSNTISCINTAL